MTTARELIDSLDPGEEFLLADGFDDALIGVVEGWWAGNHHRAVTLYDYERCVQILVEDGMEEGEAREHLDLNALGAYVGEGTPAFAVIYRQPESAPLDI